MDTDEHDIESVYYPDPSITSPNIRRIIARLRKFCLRGEYVAGKTYIASLQQQYLADLDVATYATYLHLQHGSASEAETILQNVNVDDLLLRPHAPLDEKVAVLGLLSASVKSSKYFRTEEAFALADELDQIYMIREWDLINDFDNDQERAKAQAILHQRRLWESSDPALFDDSKAPLTDRRVELEDVIADTLALAVHSGFYEQKSLQARIAKRIPPLVQYLRANNRRLAEASLMFNHMPHLQNTIQGVLWWTEYLSTLHDPENSLLEALAHGRLCEYTAPHSARATKDLILKTLSTFAELKCSSHLTATMFDQWRLLPNTKDEDPQSEQTGQDHERVFAAVEPSKPEQSQQSADLKINTAERKVRQRLGDLLTIHHKLLEHHLIHQQREVIKSAIPLVAKALGLWPKLDEFIKPSLTQMFKFGNSLQARLLQVFYFLEASHQPEYVEDARAFFEDILADKKLELNPDIFVTACKGASWSYQTLGDYKKALFFARMDFEAPYCLWYEHRRSEAAYRVANFRSLLVSERIFVDPSWKEEAGALRLELEDIASFIEFWIEQDRASLRWGGLREKQGVLSTVLLNLCQNLKVAEYEVKLQNRIQDATKVQPNHAGLSDTATLQPLLLMFSQRRIQDAVQYADQLYNQMMTTEDISPSVVGMITSAVAAGLQSSTLMQPPLSQEQRKAIVQRQYDCLVMDLEVLKLSYNESYLHRALLLHWTILDCIKFWPDRRAEYITTMMRFLEGAQDMCHGIRRTVLSDSSVDQWLRQRTLGAKFSVVRVCQVATEFFLKVEMYPIAWAWVQRGRSQALHSMLRERETATKRILMALGDNIEVSRSLRKEQQLVADVVAAGTIRSLEARRSLKAHRELMRLSPLLKEVLDGAEKPSTMFLNNLDDIWELKQYLPDDRDIILVDWFVDTTKKVWRLDVPYSQLSIAPYWTRGYITMEKIQAWKQTYLKFPEGLTYPLENRYKALSELRALLTNLDVRCKPGDLIVLSPSGELSGIPIHCIPFPDKERMPMIERNPVVYSAGLSLFRECLKRAQTPRPAQEATLLKDAVFASAYEQEGHEIEKSAIVSHLNTIADQFQSKKLLGADLTVESVRNALSTTPWIHYHGHAYYAKSEALNQCLVLGRLEQAERVAQSRVETKKQTLEAEMPFEAPLTDREALLSGHLLEGSSRLTVADVFAMNLSNTHPVVISIACDSGVQEFSPGDDPLGLVSALFCAGASSVMGTLWPIESSAGRHFSEAFYKSLAEQNKQGTKTLKDGARRVVNLAFAYRDATLAVKRVRPAPYFWAPFILQGAPIYFG